jgi:hypothetical protein
MLGERFFKSREGISRSGISQWASLGNDRVVSACAIVLSLMHTYRGDITDHDNHSLQPWRFDLIGKIEL